MQGVKAMTDVTGFALLDYFCEMCEGSGLHAEIEFDKIAVIASLSYYLDQKCCPGETQRNWNSYGRKISTLTDQQNIFLPIHRPVAVCS